MLWSPKISFLEYSSNIFLAVAVKRIAFVGIFVCHDGVTKRSVYNS